MNPDEPESIDDQIREIYAGETGRVENDYEGRRHEQLMGSYERWSAWRFGPRDPNDLSKRIK